MPVNPTMFEDPSYCYTKHHSVPFACFSICGFDTDDEAEFVRPECRKTSSASYLLANCLENFGRWIKATRMSFEAQHLHVRVFVGDAFDCCDLLRAKPPSSIDGFLIGSDVNRRIAFLSDWPSRFEYVDFSGLGNNESLLPTLVSAAPLLNLSFAESVLRTDLPQMSESISSYLQKALLLPLELVPYFLGIRAAFFENTDDQQSWKHTYSVHAPQPRKLQPVGKGVLSKLAWHPALQAEVTPISLEHSPKIRTALCQILTRCSPRRSDQRMTLAALVRLIYEGVLRSSFSDLSLSLDKTVNSKTLNKIFGRQKRLLKLDQFVLEGLTIDLLEFLSQLGLHSDGDSEQFSVRELSLPFDADHRQIERLDLFNSCIGLHLSTDSQHVFVASHVRLDTNQWKLRALIPEWFFSKS